MKFIIFFFFFFKQKTAYEMCGRDWSSDVCSSDLAYVMLDQTWRHYRYLFATTFSGMRVWKTFAQRYLAENT